MSNSELSLLHGWIRFAEIGCVIVIFGIAGEFVDVIAKWWKKKWVRVGFGIRFERLNRYRLSRTIKFCRPHLLEIETFSLALVVIGLLIEVGASHKVYRISDRQNAVLNKEAADAERDAGSATNMAAQAIAKAAKFDLARAIADQQTAIAVSNNLVLQKELQPRIISLEQITNFIFLTEKIPKIPVKISFPLGQTETGNFAYQLRQMLNEAHFPPPTNSAVWGMDPIADYMSYRTKTADTYWPSVVLYVYGTNGNFNARNFSYESTNGYARPIISGSDNEEIASGIMFALKQIGISIEEDSSSLFASPSNFVLFANDKAN